MCTKEDGYEYEHTWSYNRNVKLFILYKDNNRFDIYIYQYSCNVRSAADHSTHVVNTVCIYVCTYVRHLHLADWHAARGITIYS